MQTSHHAGFTRGLSQDLHDRAGGAYARAFRVLHIRSGSDPLFRARNIMADPDLFWSASRCGAEQRFQIRFQLFWPGCPRIESVPSRWRRRVKAPIVSSRNAGLDSADLISDSNFRDCLCTVKAYLCAGFLPDKVLGHAERREMEDCLRPIVVAIKGTDPDITLPAICNRLEGMHERTPRG